MNDFKNEYEEHNLNLAGVVFNAAENYYPEEKLSKDMVRNLAYKQGWHVFQSEVPYSKSFPKGAREGKPIITTSYARTAQKERFMYFAEEFAERISL